LDADNGKWYIAQTNHDTWKDYNADKDSGSEKMLEKAKEQIDAIGYDYISIDNLRNDVLFQHPVFNPDNLLYGGSNTVYSS